METIPFWGMILAVCGGILVYFIKSYVLIME